MQKLRAIFSFPHPVNEYAARAVAAMVVTLSLTIIVTGISWLMFVLAYGFLARVLTGPTLSPMGLLATKVLIPVLRLNKPVAGPPKRFAQTIGLALSICALALHYIFGLAFAANLAIAVLAFFATLEALAGFCTGCFIFGYMMKWGLIPQEVCEKCNNLDLRIIQ